MLSIYISKAVLRQGLIGLSAGLLSLEVALAVAYTSPALPSMTDDPAFNFSQEEGSWISSAVSASALVGSVLSGFLVDSLGSQKLSLLVAPFSIISWIWVAMSPNVLHVIGARFLTGLCVGIHFVTSSIQMAECVHPDLRGHMNMIPGIMFNGGLLLINSAGKFLQWREQAWLAAILLIPSLVLILCQPQTPLFLLKSGKKTEALKTLTWFRNSSTAAEKEINEYLAVNESSSGKESTAKFSDLFTGPNLWPVSVALILNVFQQLAGISIFFSFSTFIFEASNPPKAPYDPATCSIIMTSVNVFGNLFCSYLVAIWERRRLMRISSQMMISTLMILSLYVYGMKAGGTMEEIALMFPVIPLLSICVFVIGFSLGWGPMSFVFLGEGLPSKVMGMGSALAMSINWALTFMVSKSYFSLVSSFGHSYLFFSFASFTLGGAILVEFLMPETLQKSAAQMDKFYLDSYQKKTN